MKIINNVENWELNSTSTENKLIERLMLNLIPIAIVEETIYLEYNGEENKKQVFFEYYNNAKKDLIDYLNKHYGITKIEGAKDLSKEKLMWLEKLIEKSNPQKVNFNIKDN